MATILCIEDEVAVRRAIVDELNAAGYQTVQAGNGVDGLAAIERIKPDLVLCDTTMPKMNGASLLTELRCNHADCDDVPFFFLAPEMERADILRGYALGAEDYITKPVDFEILLAKIEAALRLVARLQALKEQQQVKLYQAFAEQMAKLGSADPGSLEGSPLFPVEPQLASGSDGSIAAAGAPNDTAAKAKREARNAVGDTLVEEVAVKFQPVWSPKAEKVIAYHGSAYQTMAGALGGDTRDRHRVEVDLMVSTRIVEHLEVGSAAKDSAAIILSVSPETLLGPRRGTFNKLLQSCPEGDRRRRLMIEVAPGTGPLGEDRLIAALEAARELAGTVILRAQPEERVGRIARICGASSLSWRFSADNEEQLPDLSQCLAEFATGTLRLGMHPYIFNLDVTGLVKSAARKGFSLIGGRAVAKELDQPGDSFILQPNRLFFD